MENKLKGNLRMIFAVKYICDQYESVWINNPDFVLVYTELKETTISIDRYPEDDIHPKMMARFLENIDLDNVEIILSYKLDREVLKLKKSNKEFYQAYNRARVLVKYGFIDEAEIGSSYSNINLISRTA